MAANTTACLVLGRIRCQHSLLRVVGFNFSFANKNAGGPPRHYYQGESTEAAACLETVLSRLHKGDGAYELTALSQHAQDMCKLMEPRGGHQVPPVPS